MAIWTWGTKVEPFVDYGNGVYLSWQVSLGARLYADLAYMQGPLSPYLNAFALLAFGTSLLTLQVLQLAVFACAVAALYLIVRHMAGNLAAATAGCIFIIQFGFKQYSESSTYNWVAPYSHAAIHGTALAFATFLLLSRFLATGRRGWLLAGGATAGLVFLTRAEIFAATAAGIAAFFFVLAALRREPLRDLLRKAAMMGACALIAPFIAFLLLSSRMPAGIAWGGVLGGWPATLQGEVQQLPFFRTGMGLDDPVRHVAVMLGAFVAFAAVICLMAWLSLRPLRHRLSPAACALLGIGVAAVLGWIWWYRPPLERPGLPLITAGVLVWAIRRRSDPFGAGFAAFALAMLGKMILNVRIHQYGFYLALPATALLIAVVLGWIPAAIARRGGNALLFRALALGVLAAGLGGSLHFTNRFLTAKTVEVAARGPDRFLAPTRGEALNFVLKELEQAGPDETVAVLPEGAMINFLSRHRNPTPYSVLMPTEIEHYGDDAVLEAYRSNPPDWIVLVHKDTSEFGFRFFGTDYARPLMRWIAQNYRTTKIGNATPLVDEHFGVMVLQRLAGRAK